MHRHSEQFHEAVVREIDEERADALGRVGRQLDDAHRSHAALVAEWQRGSPDPSLPDRIEAARAHAEHCRWMLCVQREAIGLNDHRWVDAIHPPLPRLQRRSA